MHRSLFFPPGVIDAPARNDILAVQDRHVLEGLAGVFGVGRHVDDVAGTSRIFFPSNAASAFALERDLDLFVGVGMGFSAAAGFPLLKFLCIFFSSFLLTLAVRTASSIISGQDAVQVKEQLNPVNSVPAPSSPPSRSPGR